MAAANIISVIGTGISLLSFLQSNFPDSNNDGGSKLRFAIGLDGSTPPNGGNPLSEAGGQIPDVLLFNELGTYIGYNYDPGYAGSGDSNYVVEVPQSGYENQQPTYAVLAANDDAICIAYISQTWPGNENFGWTGDWAQGCGGDHTWYWSNIIINDQEPHKPKCTWLDRNGDQPASGLQIHFPDFIEPDNGGGYSTDLNYYCNTPSLNWRFEQDDHNVIFYDPPRNYRKRSISNSGSNSNSRLFKPKSETIKRNNVNIPGHKKDKRIITELKDNVKAFLNGETFLSRDDRLVVSADPQHDPTELCTARNSAGPDFANTHHGLFCDMHTKTLKPLCGTVGATARSKDDGDCFDLNSRSLFKRGIAAPLLNYTRVIEWE